MTGSDEVGSAHVTTELTPGSDTKPLTVPGETPGGKLRGRHLSSEWLDAAAAAGLAWLAVLCVGAVCLLAPKLQFPGFARGSDPIEIFTSVVVMSLGLLRVPIHIGELTISALPLGTLVIIGAAIVWAAAGAQSGPASSVKDAARRGARVALVFACVGVLLALIFRIRGPETVKADAPWTLILAALWSFLFATAGALRSPRRWAGEIFLRLVAFTKGSSGGVGIWGGVLMIAVATLLATIAMLLWIIIGLASGPRPEFGWGDAAAAVVYLVAFLPNIVTAIVALSMGAPVLQGAQVGIGGETIGRLQEVSLLDWPGASGLVYALLVIPVVACTAGGWLVARQTTTRAGAWRPVLVAALVFAMFFGLLAWIGEARVGAGLVRDKGFARLAVLPLPTFAWGMLWASVFGWFGWELGLRRARG